MKKRLVLLLFGFCVLSLPSGVLAQGPDGYVEPVKMRVTYTTLSDYFSRVIRKVGSVRSLAREWPKMTFVDSQGQVVTTEASFWTFYSESYRMQELRDRSEIITISNSSFTTVLTKPANPQPGLCFWIASLYDAKGLVDEQVVINCGDAGVLSQYQAGTLPR